MMLTRRTGIALAIAGSALTLAAATPRVFSPGYTYRMRISGQVTEPNGKTKDYVVMSGRAMVTANGGRLDIDEASKERGAMADKGGYILYDPTSMMIVSPKDKQILKFTFADLEKGMSALAANMPGMRISITDVAVHFEKLGPGEATELRELLVKSKGRPGNLSSRERSRIKALVTKLEPGLFAKSAAMPFRGRKG